MEQTAQPTREEMTFCPATGAVKMHGIFIPAGLVRAMSVKGLTETNTNRMEVDDYDRDYGVDCDLDQPEFNPFNVALHAYHAEGWRGKIEEERKGTRAVLAV